MNCKLDKMCLSEWIKAKKEKAVYIIKSIDYFFRMKVHEKLMKSSTFYGRKTTKEIKQVLDVCNGECVCGSVSV